MELHHPARLIPELILARALSVIALLLSNYYDAFIPYSKVSK